MFLEQLMDENIIISNILLIFIVFFCLYYLYNGIKKEIYFVKYDEKIIELSENDIQVIWEE